MWNSHLVYESNRCHNVDSEKYGHNVTAPAKVISARNAPGRDGALPIC